MGTLDTTYTSPLVLADKLIGLAKAAELAGCVEGAEQLLAAAMKVLDGHVPSASWQPARTSKRAR